VKNHDRQQAGQIDSTIKSDSQISKQRFFLPPRIEVELLYPKQGTPSFIAKQASPNTKIPGVHTFNISKSPKNEVPDHWNTSFPRGPPVGYCTRQRVQVQYWRQQ